MFVRNLLQSGETISLKPGEYVTTVPVGIPLTLQYSDKGLLQKVYLHHNEDEWVDKTQDYFQILFKRNGVPNTISAHGNTSYVRGVLVTEGIFAAKTSAPDDILTELCQKYISDPDSFQFYAGDVHSNSLIITGPLAIRQWLTVSGFKVLPGYLVPQDITDKQFSHMVKLNYPFVFPLIDSYILFHLDGTITYPKTQLKQVTITSITKYVDQDGYILLDVADNLGVTHRIPYSEGVHYNIQVNSILVLDSAGTIVHCLTANNESTPNAKLSNKLRCDCCGRQLIVPASGNIKCSDPQCNSVLYPRVKQLCLSLDLPVISYEEYTKFTKQVGSVFVVLDLFEHPDYKDIQLDITLNQGLRAIVPKSVIPGDAQINQLCDLCSNSEQTLLYYIQNPDKMVIDLDLDSHVFGRFIKWIQNIENRSDIVEFFRMPNISIYKPDKSFDGAPIFRNKTIYLTGSFMHGSLDEVGTILRSYSAEITHNFSTDVNCVVIGDGQENMNGHAIIEARKHQIPVMSESEFFKAYEIDADLAANL